MRIFLVGDKKGQDFGQNAIPVLDLVLFDNAVNAIHQVIVASFQTLANLLVPVQVRLLHLLHTLVGTPHIRPHVTGSEEELREGHGFFFVLRLLHRRAKSGERVVSNVHQRAEQHAAELAEALLRVQEVDVVQVGVAADMRDGDGLGADELRMSGRRRDDGGVLGVGGHVLVAFDWLLGKEIDLECERRVVHVLVGNLDSPTARIP